MTTLILSSRHTNDSQVLWREASKIGWDVERLINWRIPDCKIHEPVVYVEPLFAPLIGELLGLNLLEPPEDWLVKLPEKYSKREISLSKFSQVKKESFVKPPNDKSFPAKVYRPEDLPKWVDDVNVLVQEPVHWLTEYRCFIAGDKVLGVSAYARNGQLNLECDEESLVEATRFAEMVCDNFKTPKAIVMDVGEVESRGWAVVELNAAWGSGIYDCDPMGVLTVLKRCMSENND